MAQISWGHLDGYGGSFRLRGTCRGVQCTTTHTHTHTHIHTHTHTHVHTPKTPVVNKDAHGNLLPQFTYSPQASSSRPNPTPSQHSGSYTQMGVC